MSTMLRAPVPRNLRVRPTLQVVAGTRLPAHGFLLIVALTCLGGLALMLGANLEKTVWADAALMLLGLLIVEGRVWGRTVYAAGAILARHARRPRRVRLGQVWVDLAPEDGCALAHTPRRPRWQREEER